MEFIREMEIRFKKINIDLFLKCGNFISSKDIFEDEKIWKFFWNLMMLRILIDS